MKRVFSIFLLLLLSVVGVQAQRATRYRLLFDKRAMGDGALHLLCCLTLDFEGCDSLVLDFGGSLQADAVEALSVTPAELRYTFDPLLKRLTLYRNGRNRERVELEYTFLNFTSVFMYANSGAEIWEYIYSSSGEFYYPMSRGSHYRGRVRFELPEGWMAVTSVGRNSQRWQRVAQGVPVNFALLQEEVYECKTLDSPYRCEIYQVRGSQAEEERLEAFSHLLTRAMAWFEQLYGDRYIAPRFGTYNYPSFILHEGHSAFNRYNMGFISASQEKFASASNLYPLIHEVGHRWLGEYTLFIPSGERGYAFIIETLNEFMTLLCIRDVVGVEAYDALIEHYREVWHELQGLTSDVHPVEVVRNDNIPVTYRKGPVMLDALAREVGYDTLRSRIVTFYKTYRGQPDLCYEDFEQTFGFQF